MIRFPRVLLAALVGAGLAVVGVSVQALVRNPLADPYLLGISSGASVGAAAAIVLGALSWLGSFAVAAGAFAGALAAVAVVLALAAEGGLLAPLRLILTGVAVFSVGNAITFLLVALADNREAARSVLFWLLGSVAGARWDALALPAVALAGCALHLLARSRALNALLAGDETAATLGVDVGRMRWELFGTATLLTAVLVSVAGAVGFVGLIVPHAVRWIVGVDHRRVLPIALVVGAAFGVLADVASRMIVAPQELPLGIVTALCGGPFFLVLMRRRLAGGPS